MDNLCFNSDISIGKNIFNGSINLIILDKENFLKYQNGKKFTCYHYIENNKEIFDSGKKQAGKEGKKLSVWKRGPSFASAGANNKDQVSLTRATQNTAPEEHSEQGEYSIYS